MEWPSSGGNYFPDFEFCISIVFDALFFPSWASIIKFPSDFLVQKHGPNLVNFEFFLMCFEINEVNMI